MYRELFKRHAGSHTAPYPQTRDEEYQGKCQLFPNSFLSASLAISPLEKKINKDFELCQHFSSRTPVSPRK